MRFQIITIFPKIFDSYINESIIKRAQEAGIINIKVHDLRDFTNDKRRTIDDRPYGGGAGMIMLFDPIYRAVKKIVGLKNLKINDRKKNSGTKIILLSAAGKTWNQTLAKKYSKLKDIVFICGRYEGVDDRVKKIIDEEISIGDYVLTGGELGALTIIDSLTRLLPGALGNAQSSEDESHSEIGVLEYPQYTKPEILEVEGHKYRVPSILLSGHHEKIKAWREQHKKRLPNMRLKAK